MDQFYTPPHLAETLIRAVQTSKKGPVVADFAVGEGELLSTAESRWPRASFIGVDINPVTVKRLRREHRSWTLLRCNFISPRKKGVVEMLRKMRGAVDLIFLNPPFSNTGNRHAVELQHHRTSCSFGLAFLMESLAYLAPGGELAAILPAGTLYSERDREAWGLITRFYSRVVLRTNGEGTFSECFAKTLVVKLTRNPYPNSQIWCRSTSALETNNSRDDFVKRGNIDMPSLNGNHTSRPIPLIHTTELRNHEIDLTRRTIDIGRASLESCAVIFPRVGRPTPDKICLLTEPLPVALSNCVLVMKCTGPQEAKRLHKKLVRNWKTLKQAYVGTCAQYTTLTRIKRVLRRLGLGVPFENGGAEKMRLTSAAGRQHSRKM